jgi:hypothetical protein
MNPILLKIVLLIALVAAAAFFLLRQLIPPPLQEDNISRHSLLLKKIEEIGNLELVKYSFNDIVEEEVKRKLLNLDNLAPDSKVLLLISGEAAACIDLMKIKENDIINSDDFITVKLPSPEICYARIIHEESKLYHMNLTAKVLNPELIERGYKNAEKIIRDEAVKDGILSKAESTAIKLLVPLFESIAGKKVILEFPRSAPITPQR